MSRLERKVELIGAVEYLLACHKDWQASADDRLREDHELFGAITLVMELFAQGDIPGNCRRLADRVAAMDEPWQKWRERCEASPARAPAQPGETFWRSIELLPSLCREVCEPRVIRHASVAELIEQKVSPAQICRIWKLLKADGSPDMDKFFEEKANPGKHTAVNPHEARARQEAETLKAKAEAARERLRQHQAAKRTLPPDSFEALVAQGISAKQLARMFHKPAAWVAEECRRLGIAEPAIEYEPLTAAKGSHDPGYNEEGQRILDAHGATANSDVDLSEFYEPDGEIVAAGQNDAVSAAPETPRKGKAKKGV